MFHKLILNFNFKKSQRICGDRQVITAAQMLNISGLDCNVNLQVECDIHFDGRVI